LDPCRFLPAGFSAGGAAAHLAARELFPLGFLDLLLLGFLCHAFITSFPLRFRATQRLHAKQNDVLQRHCRTQADFFLLQIFSFV
jgi:hypothetical protein